MGPRTLKVGCLYVLGGLPLMYLVVTAEQQGPWLIAFIVYFIAFAVFGNAYVLFGRDSNGKNNTNTTSYALILGYLIRYGGAIIFIGLSLQLIFHSLTLGFGIGAQYFSSSLPRYEDVSHIRLLAWLLSGSIFLPTGILLIFRARQAVFPMLIGIVIFLGSEVYGAYLFQTGKTSEPSSLFPVAAGLLVWAAIVIAFRIRGTLK